MTTMTMSRAEPSDVATVTVSSSSLCSSIPVIANPPGPASATTDAVAIAGGFRGDHVEHGRPESRRPLGGGCGHPFAEHPCQLLAGWSRRKVVHRAVGNRGRGTAGCCAPTMGGNGGDAQRGDHGESG